MIMMLHGEDTFRSYKRLQFLKNGFQKKYDLSGHNMFVFDSANFDLGIFHNALVSQGLLSSKRLVVAKNIFASGVLKDATDDFLEQLQKHGDSSDVILLFLEESNIFAKKVGQKKQVEESVSTFFSHIKNCELFERMNAQQTIQWVHEQARLYHGAFAPSASEKLVSLVGLDLWQLSNEVIKLVHYAQGKSIQVADVTGFVRANFSEDIFAFTDALSVKNQEKALTLLHEQLESGLSEMYILAMLVRQIRILLMLRSALKDEKDLNVIAKKLKLHPYVVKKTAPQARLFSEKRLAELYQQLVDIDARIKTTSIRPRSLLELFLVEACAKEKII